MCYRQLFAGLPLMAFLSIAAPLFPQGNPSPDALPHQFADSRAVDADHDLIRASGQSCETEQLIRQLTELNEYQQKIRFLYSGIILLVVVLFSFIITWSRNKRKQDAALLKATQLKQQESELRAALETAKLEEREREYQTLLNLTQQRQMKSYIEGLETERNRLARDLHDVVSNELVAIILKIEKDDFNKAALTETLHALHQKVRSISHALMPPVFKYAAFGDILEDYVDRQKEYFTGNIGITIHRREAWDRLPAAVALDVYRIVQEGISNALKHATAANISLQFDSDGHTFRFSIRDDGKGFDSAAVMRGIGLRNMRERAENLGGEFSIVSQPGKGTRLSVVFNDSIIS